MAIKIESDKGFRPFRITLDIENKFQANLIYAVLKISDNSIHLLKEEGHPELSNKGVSFSVYDFNFYKMHIEEMLENN
jgi:hypothetical protein